MKNCTHSLVGTTQQFTSYNRLHNNTNICSGKMSFLRLRTPFLDFTRVLGILYMIVVLAVVHGSPILTKRNNPCGDIIYNTNPPLTFSTEKPIDSLKGLYKIVWNKARALETYCNYVKMSVRRISFPGETDEYWTKIIEVRPLLLGLPEIPKLKGNISSAAMKEHFRALYINVSIYYAFAQKLHADLRDSIDNSKLHELDYYFNWVQKETRVLLCFMKKFLDHPHLNVPTRDAPTLQTLMNSNNPYYDYERYRVLTWRECKDKKLPGYCEREGDQRDYLFLRDHAYCMRYVMVIFKRALNLNSYYESPERRCRGCPDWHTWPVYRLFTRRPAE